MQKLDFNKEGKLVAYTDNGCTDGKSATTEINGIFDVSADVVKFILAKEYELPAALGIELKNEEMLNYYRCKQLYCCIGNDEQQKELESYRHRVDEQQKELESYRHRVDEQQKELENYRQRLKELSNVANKLSDVENELKRLRKAVDDFNRTRRFFERKIKI